MTFQWNRLLSVKLIFNTQNIELSFRLTQYCSRDAKGPGEIIEVGYKFLGIEPETYRLHSSAQVSILYDR